MLERMQIMIARQQRRQLMQLAQATNRSISALIRAAIDHYLEQEQTTQTQARSVLQRMKQTRESLLHARNGKPIELDIVEVVHQMRERREDELISKLSSH